MVVLLVLEVLCCTRIRKCRAPRVCSQENLEHLAAAWAEEWMRPKFFKTRVVHLSGKLTPNLRGVAAQAWAARPPCET